MGTQTAMGSLSYGDFQHNKYCMISSLLMCFNQGLVDICQIQIYQLQSDWCCDQNNSKQSTCVSIPKSNIQKGTEEA